MSVSEFKAFVEGLLADVDIENGLGATKLKALMEQIDKLEDKSVFMPSGPYPYYVPRNPDDYRLTCSTSSSESSDFDINSSRPQTSGLATTEGVGVITLNIGPPTNPDGTPVTAADYKTNPPFNPFDAR